MGTSEGNVLLHSANKQGNCGTNFQLTENYKLN